MPLNPIKHSAHLDDWVRALLDWHQQFGRHTLPWQQTNDPYFIWVSEIMLQQTQVSTVIHYYSRFLKVFPSAQHLAEAPIDKVLQYWAGLGYYRRAHHLHQAAQHIAQWTQGKGQYPTDPITWQRLPGIGRSTAASIVASAFGVAAGILDGNVRRVLARYWLGIDNTLSLSPKHIEALWKISEVLVTQTSAQKTPRQWNQTLMDIGAMVCIRRPLCESCPVKHGCNIQKSLDTQAIVSTNHFFNLPKAHHHVSSVRLANLTRKTRPNIVSLKIRVLVFRRYHKKNTSMVEFWLEKRSNKGLWAGLWCFPLLMPAVLTCSSTKRWPRLSSKIYQAASVVKILPVFEHRLTHRHFEVQPLLIDGIDKTMIINDLSTFSETLEGQWVPHKFLHKKGTPVLVQKTMRCMTDNDEKTKKL